ncbi:two-component system response regulator [Paenibacillus sp. 32O-W]|uniref:response regulator n=1 Tax=Paenibacillus sp. 32O-W TaxID=1695218 RepID=UPI00071EE7D4|nr:response regulator [Paenibacillus sp. 32O-W]ALS26382.1 two-component system response regulator [Paenibacillus sp. 32O-W]
MTGMKHLLIVDDEAHWTDNLADHKPWGEVGIDVVHKAYSAFEALELIQTYPVDLVITDIMMPEWTGLELIEEIRKRRPDTVCILLSGYSDFEYARTAIELEAFDYLLKPVKDEELFRVVRQALSRLERLDEKERLQRRLAYSLNENMPLIRSHLLSEWLTGTARAADWENCAVRYGIPFRAGDEVLLVLVRPDDRLGGGEGREAPKHERKLAEYAIQNIAEEWMSSGGFDVWSCWLGRDYMAMLLRCGNGRPPAPDIGDAQALERLLLGLQQNIKRFAKASVSLLMTDPHRFPDEVHAACEKALISFRQQVGGRQELLLAQEDAAPPLSAKSLRTLHCPPSLLQLMEVQRWQEAEALVERMLTELETDWSESHEHLLAAAMEIGGAFLQLAHRSGIFLRDAAPELTSGFIAGEPMRSIAALRRWASSMLQAMRRHMREEAVHNRRETIRRVHEYIERHLKTDASLRAIADYVHMHPTHLSKIYKQETGQGLSDYLMQVRMEKACALLSGSQLKVYEICEEIGYLDPAYFIKVFRKFYGVTPQEYRDRVNAGK